MTEFAPSKGPWLFHNVTQDFDCWPLLDSISISQLHPDGIMTMSGSVVDEDASLTFEDDDEFRVTFRGVRIWAGHIRVTGRSITDEVGPRVWSLTGQDFTAKLDDSVILSADERPRESIASRVAWILSFLDYPLTTDNVSLPSETVEAAGYEGSTVGEALQQVCDEKLLHLYADFTKDIHMFRTETVAAPFDLSVSSPNLTTEFPFSGFDLQTDTIELTNAVRVKGKRHKTWRTNAASISAFGRQESAIVDDALTTMEQVVAAGDRRLYQLAEPIVDGALVCWEPGLMAGMTFHLTHPEWDIDADYIVTEVEITAAGPHDDEGDALLHSAIRFSDKRRVGRFPGSGKDVKEANKPDGPGSGATDPPGVCCNPVPTGPAEFISWGESNIMGVKQGYTSGTSHSFLLPDGSGYEGGVVAGDITGRRVILFHMTVGEVGGSSGGSPALLSSPWESKASTAIGCTHGVAPFNNGHPNMQTRVWALDVDDNPAEYDPTGAVVVVSSSQATEVLWVSVLIGGTGPSGDITAGPSATDWDVPDWTSPALAATDERALYLSVAFNAFWDHTEHPSLTPGSPLFPEQHDTPVIGGIPTATAGADGTFQRLAAAVGGDKTLDVDYVFSPVNDGSGLPDLELTGYIGSSSGSQDQIITALYGVGVVTTATGVITAGPTWEGGNPLLHNPSAPSPPSYTIVNGVITLTSDTPTEGFSWSAVGPPDLPTSIGDWIITQEFNLDVAGSLTDDGRRYLEIAADFDGKYLAASVRFGDDGHAQGVLIDGDPDVFTAKDITEGEDYTFQVKWDGTTLYARFWLTADGEPAAGDWDVEASAFEDGTSSDDDQLDRFFYAVGLGNESGPAQVLILQPPTIEGLALPGESVDWEIVGYGDNATTTFLTRYPYDELSLHVRVDGQMLNGTAFTMDGAAGTITLDSAPYGDPSDPTGSSVVEARYTRT